MKKLLPLALLALLGSPAPSLAYAWDWRPNTQSAQETQIDDSAYYEPDHNARIVERNAAGEATAAVINGVRKWCPKPGAGCSNVLEADVARSRSNAERRDRQNWELNTPEGRAYRAERLDAWERYQDSRAEAIGRCTAQGIQRQPALAICVKAQGYNY